MQYETLTQWLEQHNIVGEGAWSLIQNNDCPQQLPGSNDCGIFVMRWIECTLKGLDLRTETLDGEVVHNLRVDYVQKLINNENLISNVV